MDDIAIFDAYVVGKPTCFFRDVAERIPIAYLHVSLHEGEIYAACFAAVANAPGTLGDPHLGPVCSGCYAELTATRLTLEKIGPLVGIGACSSEVNH